MFVHHVSRCGLVALAMADSILQREVSLDQLTAASQAQGFSKQGEIFSGGYGEIISMFKSESKG